RMSRRRRPRLRRGRPPPRSPSRLFRPTDRRLLCQNWDRPSNRGQPEAARDTGADFARAGSTRLREIGSRGLAGPAATAKIPVERRSVQLDFGQLESDLRSVVTREPQAILLVRGAVRNRIAARLVAVGPDELIRLCIERYPSRVRADDAGPVA